MRIQIDNAVCLTYPTFKFKINEDCSMLDLGNKKLERFSLPEEIVGERIVLVPRTHEFDEALWQLIDNSREFLREYLFWVDDTKSLQDVTDVTSILSRMYSRARVHNDEKRYRNDADAFYK